MRREEHIDYFLVPDGQVGIHEALCNWARWVRVRPHGWQISPMFRQYRSHAWQWERPDIPDQTNVPEAVAMEKAVSLLPEKHRTAVRWSYVMQSHPARMARELGVSKQGLLDLVNDARLMLRNRGMA
jgi:DNA-directed RNA polymerase specialized sigma24 family protein